MKKCTFKEGLQITASTIEAAKIVATRVNRVGSNTTEFAFPVLDQITKKLVSKIHSAKISRLRQGYALVDTPKGYQIEFEMNDNIKDSFVRVLSDGNVKTEFKINNWYDTTIPELYEKISTELKQRMKAAASAK